MLLALSALAYGFRHGIDWDHIAALTDITGSQNNARQSMVFATLYALGHAFVVLTLGTAAIVFGSHLPTTVDSVMGRVVGLTLLVLAAYVVASLVKNGRRFRMRSRWMLALGGIRRGARWLRHQVVEVVHDHAHSPDEVHAGASRAHDHLPVEVPAGRLTPMPGSHRHAHQHVATMPDDPFMSYGRTTAVGVGMLHGIGAETPTQLLLLVAAAGTRGTAGGLLLLGAFVVGLLSSNTLIALVGSFGFLGASRHFGVYVGVSLATALCSGALGIVFLMGHATTLPALFGG